MRTLSLMPRSDAYDEDALLPMGEAAEVAGVSVATLRRYEKRGLITAKRTPSGHRRFCVADLRGLLVEPKVESSSGAA